jgi:hypothetical protein
VCSNPTICMPWSCWRSRQSLSYLMYTSNPEFGVNGVRVRGSRTRPHDVK